MLLVSIKSPPGSSFGSFQWVNANVINFDIDFTVGCEVTQAVCPFGSGVRVSGTDVADGTFGDTLTALTVFNNNLAAAFFGNTTSFFPEGTLGTG